MEFDPSLTLPGSSSTRFFYFLVSRFYSKVSIEKRTNGAAERLRVRAWPSAVLPSSSLRRDTSSHIHQSRPWSLEQVSLIDCQNTWEELKTLTPDFPIVSYDSDSPYFHRNTRMKGRTTPNAYVLTLVRSNRVLRY